MVRRKKKEGYGVFGVVVGTHFNPKIRVYPET